MVAVRLLSRRAAGVAAARPAVTRALIPPTGRPLPALLLTTLIRLPPPIDGRSVLLPPLRVRTVSQVALLSVSLAKLGIGIPVLGKHLHGSKKGGVPRLTIELIK